MKTAIQDAVTALRSAGAGERRWLLVAGAGRNASCNAAREQGFSILTLGGDAARYRADVAFVLDVETIRHWGEEIAALASLVIMPFEPHENGWASGKPLLAYADQEPALRPFAVAGRLLGVHLWTARNRKAADRDRFFGDLDGTELPLRILARAGVKFARHLSPRLARTGTAGFEAARSYLQRQTGGIAAIRREFGLSYGPYDFPVPADIFVGSDEEQLLGLQVLHYSIEKFSSMDVRVSHLDYKSLPVPKDPENRSKTGFSFCRFEIPRLRGYKGRGAYVDADMLVFADVEDLWTTSLDEADLLYSYTAPAQGRARQTSVMLLNCENLPWDVHEIVRGLDDNRYSYQQLMSDLCIVPKERLKPLLPYWWNSLEVYEPGRTSLLHYTEMKLQPWVSNENPNSNVWYRFFSEALDQKFIDEAEVGRAIQQGHVSPEIFAWAGRAVRDYGVQPATWIAPYNRFLGPQQPEGAVMLTSARRIVGWVWDPKKPDEPIEMGVFDGDKRLLSVRCDGYGEFLAKYGKGNGYHCFDVAVPPSDAATLSVRTLDRKFELRGSPLRLTPTAA